MSEQITINEGEVVVKFNKPTAGKLSFADLPEELSEKQLESIV